jgi:hypothetical protein
MTRHPDQISKHRSTKRPWRTGVSIGDLAARLAQIWDPVLRIAQIVLLVVTVALIACLASVANHQAQESWPGWVPRWLQWLDQGDYGGDWRPIVLVTAVIALLCILTYRLRRNRSSSAVPVMIVAGLTATTVVLGFASYSRCTNEAHPKYIAPLLWTASLVKGSVSDISLQSARLANAKLCPSNPTPTALEVARLAIVAAIFISLAGVAAAAFRAQYDRLRAALARSVTVVLDLDDDSTSMIGGIARTLRANSTLVVMTDNPAKAFVSESRRHGARVVQVDFDRPRTVVAHYFWRRLNRLYLLSADPSTNLLRLSTISQRLAHIATKRRIPLIVRIDDPWLAEAWRTQQFGQHGSGSDHLWAADTVSKYEATARRLIDQVLDNKAVRRLIICGTSQLTLALCAEMALRDTERRFHTREGEPELPALTLFALDAGEYTGDYEARQKRKGFSSGPPPVDAVTDVPSASAVRKHLEEARYEDATTAVIVVESVAAADPILGTRLAANHPTMPIYIWDPAARLNSERIPVACELRTYRLGMELPDGHAHDNFERTAMLIHERYASSQADRTKPASLPWEGLNDFYKDSNRRQLTNALWMVEKIAGHTWKTGDIPRDDISPESVEQLDAVGAQTTSPVSEDAVYAMAQTEWEDWSRYLRARGWTWGPRRNTKNKQHERLVDSWEATLADPKLKDLALKSAADTQIALAKLQRLDFNEDEAYATAQAEWEDWSRFLRARGWTLGDTRDTKNKQHERLVDSWEAALADPELKAVALKSLADTQIALAKLYRLGFNEDEAYAMAQAEWEDWSRYLRKHGWTQGDERDEPNKKHEKLLDNWEDTVVDPELKAAALKSLAGTVIELMKLGYRSRPMWKTYERVGTVTAKHRRTAWNWTTASGKTAHASAGTWEVCDSGHSWPVRNDIFHASYRRLQADKWERKETVLARSAQPGETIHTLDGPETAADGDWVIQGNRGEQWLVPSDEFRRRYRGPVPVYQSSKEPIAETEPARV